MTDIVLINQSALITAADLASAMAVFQIQIDRDLAPAWGVSGSLHIGSAPAGAWNCFLQDGIGMPSALGFHVDDAGNPEMHVDIAGSIAAGQDWRTVVSHELIEGLCDPTCSLMSPDGRFVREPCDPVEETLYLINGLAVSNFVLPFYFGIPQVQVSPPLKYDFNGQLAGPAPMLLGGGYIMEDVDGAWVSHFGRKADGSLAWMATRPGGRSAWRARQERPLASSAPKPSP